MQWTWNRGMGGRILRNLPALWALALLGAWNPAQPARAEEPVVDIGLGTVETRTVPDDPARQGHVYRTQLATFTMGAQHYGIRYHIGVDTANQNRLVPGEGYLGMPSPSSANWYHGGFLFLSINGQDIGARNPLSSMMVTERGQRAMLDLVWHDPLASVRARFLALPGYDCLFCQLAIEPNGPVQSIGLRLVCYPSYFTAWNKRDGARRIRTPAGLIEQGKPATGSAKDHWWAVYYDEIFDVARGEGDGPCALLVLPDEPDQIAFDPGSYAVSTRIAYPAATRQIRLAFWDFRGKTNAEALARLAQGAAQVRQTLATLDFTPRGLQEWDVSALRAGLGRLMQSDTIRAALGAKATEVEAWLREFARVPETPASAPNRIAAEERTLLAMEKYQDFAWELKLAELLATF